jgi:hypothetical protein
MIGELLYADETTARTGFVINKDNIFVEQGKFNEAGLLENIAQTAAAGIGYTAGRGETAAEIKYIGSVRNFEILELPKVNDELTTTITIEEKIFDAVIVNGTTWCNNVLIARCEMRVFSAK